MPQITKHKKRVGKIELLRFLFCLLILLYHTGKDNKSRGWMFTDTMTFFNKGFIGVDFFFLVTGYVTAAAIFSQLGRQKQAGSLTPATLGENTWHFMWKKIRAILPFHLIIIAATIVFRTAFLGKTLPSVLIKGLPSFFFVQMNGYSSSSLIGVEWYISSMLYALIIIYPLCFAFYDVFTHIVAPAAGLLISGYIINSFGTFGRDGELNGLLTNGTLRAVAHICLGIFLFELVRLIKTKQPTKAVRAALTIIEPLAYLTVVYMSMAIGYTREWMGSMLLFMIIGFTISFSELSYGSDVFNNKFCYFLGKASLPIYLVQNLIRDIIRNYFKDMASVPKIFFTVGSIVIVGCILQLIVGHWQKNREKKIAEQQA